MTAYTDAYISDLLKRTKPDLAKVAIATLWHEHNLLKQENNQLRELLHNTAINPQNPNILD